MATTGNITKAKNERAYTKVQITGLQGASNSPDFNLDGFVYSSYHAKLVGGTAPTGVQAQGSNDGGLTWVNIGTSFTVATPVGGTLTPSQQPYELYQFAVSGGDGTTNIEIDVIAYGNRG